MIFCSFWPDFSRSKKTILSPSHPSDSLVEGIVYALISNSDNLPVVRDKVTEGAAAAAGVAGHPGNATVGRVFDAVVGWVDSDQLVVVGY